MRMPNIQESGCDSFAGSESRVWKILPEFIRKKSGTNKKRQAAVAAVSGAGGLKLTESVCSGDNTADTKNDECRVVVTAAPAPQPPAKQSHTKKSLDCRRSWTYGYCDSGPAAAACDNSDTGDGGDRYPSYPTLLAYLRILRNIIIDCRYLTHFLVETERKTASFQMSHKPQNLYAKKCWRPSLISFLLLYTREM